MKNGRRIARFDRRRPFFLKPVLTTHILACILCLVATALVAPMHLSAASTKNLGTWVWSDSAFSTDEARQELFHFCVKHQIDHLDVYMTMSGDEEKPVVHNAAALRDLILLAGLHNIATEGLRGDPKMFFSENHEQTLQELRAIIAFYETLPADNLFKGIKYDVEPYRTKEWKAGGESRERVMLDYLTFLRKARDLLKKEAPHLCLAADTPFWWDKDALVVEFEGKTKRFSEHVQDLTDFVVIMSYRRSVKKVLDCVENERRYAKQINKLIFPSLETVELKQDPDISFWGLTTHDFLSAVSQLLEIARGDPTMGGVMIHCYRSLVNEFNDKIPGERVKKLPDSVKINPSRPLLRACRPPQP